jgi:hypothetical protein
VEWHTLGQGGTEARRQSFTLELQVLVASACLIETKALTPFFHAVLRLTERSKTGECSTHPPFITDWKKDANSQLHTNDASRYLQSLTYSSFFLAGRTSYRTWFSLTR